MIDQEITPSKQDGLVPPPLDPIYEAVPVQMRKPLIIENSADDNDLRNVYNPNKAPTRRENYGLASQPAPQNLTTPTTLPQTAQTNTTNVTVPALTQQPVSVN